MAEKAQQMTDAGMLEEVKKLMIDIMRDMQKMDEDRHRLEALHQRVLSLENSQRSDGGRGGDESGNDSGESGGEEQYLPGSYMEAPKDPRTTPKEDKCFRWFAKLENMIEALEQRVSNLEEQRANPVLGQRRQTRCSGRGGGESGNGSGESDREECQPDSYMEACRTLKKGFRPRNYAELKEESYRHLRTPQCFRHVKPSSGFKRHKNEPKRFTILPGMSTNRNKFAKNPATGPCIRCHSRDRKRLELRGQSITRQRIISVPSPAFPSKRTPNTSLSTPKPETLATNRCYSSPPRIPIDVLNKNFFPSRNLGSEPQWQCGEVYQTEVPLSEPEVDLSPDHFLALPQDFESELRNSTPNISTGVPVDLQRCPQSYLCPSLQLDGAMFMDTIQDVNSGIGDIVDNNTTFHRDTQTSDSVATPQYAAPNKYTYT